MVIPVPITLSFVYFPSIHFAFFNASFPFFVLKSIGIERKNCVVSLGSTSSSSEFKGEIKQILPSLNSTSI